MNLFNCFQAVGFYTLLPWLINYLFNNNYSGFGYVACIVLFVGYIMLSLALEEAIGS